MDFCRAARQGKTTDERLVPLTEIGCKRLKKTLGAKVLKSGKCQEVIRHEPFVHRKGRTALYRLLHKFCCTVSERSVVKRPTTYTQILKGNSKQCPIGCQSLRVKRVGLKLVEWVSGFLSKGIFYIKAFLTHNVQKRG